MNDYFTDVPPIYLLDSNPDELKTLFKRLDKIDNAAFFIFDLDKNKFTHVNSAVERICGYPSQTIIDSQLDCLQRLIHQTDIPSNFDQDIPGLKFSNELTRKVTTHEFRFKHSKGNWIWLEATLTGLLPDHGAQVIGALQDITVRKLKENFLWNELQKREKNISKIHSLKQTYQSITDDMLADKDQFQQFFDQPVPHTERQLSERELEVLRLIASGYSSKQLADKLNISNHTAISHRKNLLEKFRVKNTAELIKEASKCFWLE